MHDENEVRTLAAAVQEMKVASATMAATLVAVQATLGRIEKGLEHHVTRREFDELKADVDKQASNWSKIAWFIGLTVAGALLAVVLKGGGAP